MGGFHGLEGCANVSSTDISLDKFNDDLIAKLEALLAGKMRYKKLDSVIRGGEVEKGLTIN